ncbi:MAG: sulfurtransferase TusA family protein [Cellulosilyticaceae bacterium]
MNQVILDCLYEPCPIPLLKVVKEIEALNKGDIIIVEADHTCVVINIKEWAEQEGHGFDYLEVENGLWEIYIEKSR